MRKFDQRRLEIIDCAAHFFAAKGYDATGIAELSDAVGVGRGTLYHYIGSKEDILAEIHYRANTPLLVLGREVRDLEESGAVRLRLLSEVFFEVQYRLLEHSRVVMYESKRLTGAGREGYISTQREFRDMVRRILRGRQKGRFPALRRSVPGVDGVLESPRRHPAMAGSGRASVPLPAVGGILRGALRGDRGRGPSRGRTGREATATGPGPLA